MTAFFDGRGRDMSLRWACLRCEKEFQQANDVMEHIVADHFNGDDTPFTEMMQWILLRVVPEKA